jgi:drug/metabolite transporter (DMT)-like permease
MKIINLATRPALITAAILLIPLIGNMTVDDWNWPWTAFVLFGAMLLSAGVAYELAGKRAKAGVFIGFVCGVIIAAGVIAILRYLNPDEDIAGIVIIAFLLFGFLFAFFGYLIQQRLYKK